MKLYWIFLVFLTINLSAKNISEGESLYKSVCFACHGKNLEGATGPKLTDVEWLHGGSKEQIINSIEKGFPEKGMVAFGSVFNSEQISDLVDFILSRQHGLRSMEYKVYHNVTVETKLDWQNQKPDKQLKLNFPRVNLNLPEVDQFGLSFKGTILIAEHLAGDYTLKGLIRQQNGFEILIDNKKLDIKFTDKSRFEAGLKLVEGYHDFEFRYIKDFKDGTLLLDLEGKGHIPISGQSIQKSMTSSHIVKANESFTITRKRIQALPPGSIIVNHQDRLSYAINPKDGSIDAVWSGKSLDIGPNIYTRGQQAAKTLGKQLFDLSESIELLIDGEQRQLKFVGYANKPSPKFIYRYGADELSIESFLDDQELVFNYISSSPIEPDFKLSLPNGLDFIGAFGKREGHIFTPQNQSFFQISIPFEEVK